MFPCLYGLVGEWRGPACGNHFHLLRSDSAIGYSLWLHHPAVNLLLFSQELQSGAVHSSSDELVCFCGFWEGLSPPEPLCCGRMLALIGSLTFQDTRLSVKWLATNLLLTNSAAVFGMTVYLTAKREGLNRTLEETLRLLRETRNQLENQNAQLTQAKRKKPNSLRPIGRA